MSQTDARITELEIQMSHQTQVIDDLSDIVARQDIELAKLARKMTLLLENAADSQSSGGVVLADQKPPHW